jgi:hypothetical protein
MDSQLSGYKSPQERETHPVLCVHGYGYEARIVYRLGLRSILDQPVHVCRA